MDCKARAIARKFLDHYFVNVFVNYGGFAFDRPEMTELTDLFWKQMEWISPESYIAEGTHLNFASANKGLFASIRRLLQG